ncbi:MAG: FkbM family methyltransferase [Cyclobacteriaceae bacterium]
MRFSTFKERWHSVLASILGKIPGITRLYYRLFYSPTPNTTSFKINESARQISDFTFLQIGGNDGFINDPIFKLIKKYNWSGVIVEPQTWVFNNRLKRTYLNDSRVKLEHVAIDKEPGTKKLYKLSITDARWATGLATFDRETLVNQIERNYVDRRASRDGLSTPSNTDDYIVHEEVACTTITHLLKKHKFEKLDLLQIDTEGYDFEIIKTIDFDFIKPRIVCFEMMHLSDSDKQACEALFEQHGYRFEAINSDGIAVLHE